MKDIVDQPKGGNELVVFDKEGDKGGRALKAPKLQKWVQKKKTQFKALNPKVQPKGRQPVAKQGTAQSQPVGPHPKEGLKIAPKLSVTSKEPQVLAHKLIAAPSTSLGPSVQTVRPSKDAAKDSLTVNMLPIVLLSKNSPKPTHHGKGSRLRTNQMTITKNRFGKDVCEDLPPGELVYSMYEMHYKDIVTGVFTDEKGKRFATIIQPEELPKWETVIKVGVDYKPVTNEDAPSVYFTHSGIMNLLGVTRNLTWCGFDPKLFPSNVFSFFDQNSKENRRYYKEKIRWERRILKGKAKEGVNSSDESSSYDDFSC
ncbi:unnamed protein product [Cuscuta epithymum]|uniref:Uncharacterized protein n=1 Tax=Cuscuta epithymum TaxID=186058 RepID=A0AAV0GLZ6_9ASTE|nr:unnamed protein product [Cuscuta epithymum]